MKNATLLALHQVDEIPLVLLSNWMAARHEIYNTPIDEAELQVQNSKLIYSPLGIIGPVILGVGSVAFLLSPHPLGSIWETKSASALFSFGCACFGVLFCIVAVVGTEKRYSEFGTDLEDLKELLMLNFGQMRCTASKELKEVAERKLIYQASLIIHSPLISKEEEEARIEFKRQHTLLLKFLLVEEKWDKYFKNLEKEPTRDKTPVQA